LINTGIIVIHRHINNISKETETLLRKLLISDPNKRISAQELFNYDFSYIERIGKEKSMKD